MCQELNPYTGDYYSVRRFQKKRVRGRRIEGRQIVLPLGRQSQVGPTNLYLSKCRRSGVEFGGLLERNEEKHQMAEIF